MALTDQQVCDVRRYLGATARGDDIPIDDSRDMVYGFVSPGVWQTLYHRLNHLLPSEENTLINTYLVTLNKLEKDLTKVGENMDSLQAASWKWNPNELSDRRNLFEYWKGELFKFLFPCGKYNGNGSARLVRS